MLFIYLDAFEYIFLESYDISNGDVALVELSILLAVA